MIATDVLMAGRNLLRHTRRSLFLAGALASVTALLVLVSSLTAGIEHAMMESATTLMTGHVNVGGFFKITSGERGPAGLGLPEGAGEVLAARPRARLRRHPRRGATPRRSPRSPRWTSCSPASTSPTSPTSRG